MGHVYNMMFNRIKISMFFSIYINRKLGIGVKNFIFCFTF